MPLNQVDNHLLVRSIDRICSLSIYLSICWEVSPLGEAANELDSVIQVSEFKI